MTPEEARGIDQQSRYPGDDVEAIARTTREVLDLTSEAAIDPSIRAAWIALYLYRYGLVNRPTREAAQDRAAEATVEATLPTRTWSVHLPGESVLWIRVVGDPFEWDPVTRSYIYSVLDAFADAPEDIEESRKP